MICELCGEEIRQVGEAYTTLGFGGKVAHYECYSSISDSKVLRRLLERRKQLNSQLKSAIEAGIRARDGWEKSEDLALALTEALEKIVAAKSHAECVAIAKSALDIQANSAAEPASPEVRDA